MDTDTPVIGDRQDGMMPEICTPMESGESMALLGRIMEIEEAMRRKDEAQRMIRGDVIGVDNTRRMMADIATMEMRLRSVEGSIQDAASARIPIEGIYSYEEYPEADDETASKAVAKMSKAVTGQSGLIAFDTVVCESDASILLASAAPAGQGGIIVKKAGYYLVGCTAGYKSEFRTAQPGVVYADHVVAIMKNAIAQEHSGSSVIIKTGQSTMNGDNFGTNHCVSAVMYCAVNDKLSISGSSSSYAVMDGTAFVWAIEI